MESIDFDELQQMAEEAVGRVEGRGSEDEEKAWVEKLIKGDGRKRDWGDGPLGDATDKNNQRDFGTQQHDNRPHTPSTTQQTSTTHRSSPPSPPSPPSQSSKRTKMSSSSSEGQRSLPSPLRSPLFDAEVFLPKTLMKFGSVLGSIGLHSPHSVLLLTSDIPPPSTRTRIVLIEAHKHTHSRAVINELYAIKKKAWETEVVVVGWEVYDWRVVMEGVVDWSLHHACTV